MLQREVIKTNEFEDSVFDVDFMSCVVDKSDDLRVIEADSHFSDFSGVHPSKINQGKLTFLDILHPKERQTVMKQLCKKNSPYIYIDFNIKNRDDEYILVHCLGQNVKNSSICRLALADVSQSERKTKLLKRKADRMNRIVDYVECGVCLFRVTQDMHFEPLYMNRACEMVFSGAKNARGESPSRLDEIIHPEDKSPIYQAVGNSMATKKPINTELRVMSNKGYYIWIQFDSAIQRYEDNGCPVFHAVLTDITKLKDEIAENETAIEYMNDIFSSLPAPIFFTNTETPFEIGSASDEFLKLIGYSKEEFFDALEGNLKHIIVSPDVEDIEKDFIEGAKNSSSLTLLYTIKTKDKRLLEVSDERKITRTHKGDKASVAIIKVKNQSDS